MRWEPSLSFEQLRVVGELARRGTLLNPARAGNWLALTHVLVKLSLLEEAVACAQQAIGVLPESLEVRLRLGQILFAFDRFNEAMIHAEIALRMAPSDPRAIRLHLDLLTLTIARPNPNRALVAAYAANNPRLLALHVEPLDAASIVTVCDSLLAEKPGHTHATHLKAIALTRLGRVEEACRLISLDRLVTIEELPAPTGYSDAQTFRRALAAEIEANPTLDGNRSGKAGHDSLQTRNLRQPGAVAIETLLDQIRNAVDAYESRLLASDDPFARARPRQARLEPWAMVSPSDGWQSPHIHPSGWLTGVYYVAAPRPNGANAYYGPLVLGAINSERLRIDPPWGVSEIEPVPGRLVLFPSYLSHATLPSGVDGSRICVAFDVVDAASTI
jgi:uncharacterized protein (TIGR02466 family)